VGCAEMLTALWAAFAAVCGARLGSDRPQADFGQFACAGPGSGVLGENHYRALVRLDLINAALCERLDGLRAVVPDGGASATAGRPRHDHGLSSLVDTLSYGTLMRRLAAIAHQHRQHGLAIPAIDPAGKALLRAVPSPGAGRDRPRVCSHGWPPPARAILPGCAIARCFCWPPERDLAGRPWLASMRNELLWSQAAGHRSAGIGPEVPPSRGSWPWCGVTSGR
jgi:hypothetical protein